MTIQIQGAREHNLQEVNAEIGPGLTVVTGVSGSGKTSLVFDVLYHEARRRFIDLFTTGASLRLAPAEVDEITGLGPAVAVGQNLLNRNPNSILATAAGLHPFLRLLYTHFGQRHCQNCGTPVELLSDDAILSRLEELALGDPLVVAAPICPGPGSHRTLLAALSAQFGEAALQVDGGAWSGKPLEAGKAHEILVQLLVWEPRDTQESASGLSAGFRRALQQARALGASSLAAFRPGGPPAWRFALGQLCGSCGAWFEELRPLHFHQACPACGGSGCERCEHTGLVQPAASVRWRGLSFPELLARSVDDCADLFARGEFLPAADRLREEITRRLEALQSAGLGYLALDRPSPTLSRGEAQRVRLALILVSRLEDMLHVLDEPTVGQHPADVRRLLPVFRRLAGPVVFVEHDREAAAYADQAIDLGPGAGQRGGRVVFAGSPANLWDSETITGRYFSRLTRLQPPTRQKPTPTSWLKLGNATLRNLKGIDLAIPLKRLTAITGVSGAGKSTLVEDVLVASLEAAQPIGCQTIEGPLLKPVIVDQSPIGRNPRSNPATYTKLADILRDLFAEATNLGPSYFSFNRPEGACPACAGLGANEVTMRYLPPTWITCVECGGKRFSEEVLTRGIQLGSETLNIAEVLALDVDHALLLLAGETRLSRSRLEPALRILQAMQEIGLGYLPLGQPSPTLSGGEAQRVKLARHLGKKSLAGQLLVLDEPSTGLHPYDLAGLLQVLQRLTASGGTVVVVEHNLDVIRAADWIIELGPGGGPRGGELLYAGPALGLEGSGTPTGEALRLETSLHPSLPADAQAAARRIDQAISIRGARAHNLKNVSVDFPKGSLSVVTGVSGSGKSSLVRDVLEAEARRRFLETLSLYERQGVQEGPEAEVEAVTGLGVALAVNPERLIYSRRATVGTATELLHHLAVLMAEWGERACPQCGAALSRLTTCPACGAAAPLASARHFSAATYAAACRACNGVGSHQVPQPEKLIIHPEKPLIAGAMYSPGFFPNGYLGQPYNGGYYMLQALAKRFGFDPSKTPWNEMTPEAQQAFLYGIPDLLQVEYVSRNGRVSRGQRAFPGFYGFVGEWDVGGTYTRTEPCPACQGKRLRPEYLAVSLDGRSISDLCDLSLRELAQSLERIATSRAGKADRPSLSLVLSKARQRLGFLIQVGLGYLHLDRPVGTLSAGEVQRIRLAGLLGSQLTSLTILLDEPTRGLHPAEVKALVEALHALRAEGNTVIVVEHDPLVMRLADHLVDVGPGAGVQGGEIIAQGSLEQIARQATPTGLWLRGERTPQIYPPRSPQGWLVIHGAQANNLKNIDVALPLGVLAGVCGVSGSGKSTLIIDTLGRALAPKKQTTSVAYEPVEPGEHAGIEGAPIRAMLIDQSRAGMGSPASFLGLTPLLRNLYTESEAALALGLGEADLARRCSTCGGSGYLALDMEFLPDIHQPCEACRGTGFSPEAWQVRLKGLSLPEVYSLTIDQVQALFGSGELLGRLLSSAQAVGLGYLALRQPGFALSGGEAQRLKIAQELARKAPRGTLYILDEPTVGQHLEDVQRLVGVLRGLVAAGHSVIVVEHHPHLLAACDWLVELGPGGGPEGGWLVAQGTPAQLAAGNTPTAPYVREVLG